MRRVVLSSRTTSRDCSKADNCLLTAGADNPSARAAAAILPLSHTLRKVLMWSSLAFINS